MIGLMIQKMIIMRYSSDIRIITENKEKIKVMKGGDSNAKKT